MRFLTLIWLGRILIGIGIILFSFFLYSLIRGGKRLQSERKQPNICKRCAHQSHAELLSGLGPKIYTCSLGLAPRIYLKGLFFKRVASECREFKEVLTEKQLKERFAQFKPN